MNNKGELNMRIKKIIGVIFVVLIMLILVACGGKTDDETSNKDKATPSLNIGNVVETQDSVSFELEIVDVDKVGEIKSIELYQEDELVKSLEDLNLREFKEILSNNLYEIRVTYEYDLNDGAGVQEVIVKKAVTSLEKATPSL